MSAGITIGFMSWKRDFYLGFGKGRFTIAELSGTLIGLSIAVFVKVG